MKGHGLKLIFLGAAISLVAHSSVSKNPPNSPGIAVTAAAKTFPIDIAAGALAALGGFIAIRDRRPFRLG